MGEATTKIIVQQVYDLTWQAVDEATLSGPPFEPVGRGKTPIEAVADLMEQIADAKPQPDPDRLRECGLTCAGEAA